jgi:hypothetical protein
MLDAHPSHAGAWPKRNASPRAFYLAMSLLMLAVVTYGFSRTVGQDLIHSPRPHRFIARFIALLAFHGAVFYMWMILFVAQSALVRGRNLRLHRMLGWVGAADALLVLGMGIWASFAEPLPFALERIGLVSMLGFGIPVALGILWRKRPAYHRRLMFVGTAMLTNAAFARFPGSYLPGHFFYLGTDLIVAIGVAHDVWKERRVHVVYCYAVPLLLAAEVCVLIPAWHFLG